MLPGRPIVRKYIRDRYSPVIPSTRSCAPEKIAIIEARKGNPGRLYPRIRYLPTAYINTPIPKRVSRNPIRLANFRG